MSSDPPRHGRSAARSRRAELDCASSLRELREEAFRTLGLERAVALLYGVGLAEGLIDAMRVRQGFEEGATPTPKLAGSALPLLFQREEGELHSRFRGALATSLEAELHLAGFPAPSDPVCFVSAGYAAGWYSELLGESVLARETECRACGAPACRFEARPRADWESDGDGWMAALLPHLDLETLRERAAEVALGLEEDLDEGPMLGRFDPMSPAAHIWGPVMILPYSGSEDSEAAIDVIQQDIGHDQVRVVVIDVTGARIDALEASGIARLLDRIEGLQVEAILAGLDREGARFFSSRRAGVPMPLLTRDVSEGIALGFQMCQGSRGAH